MRSLARAYTDASIKVLSGYVTAPETAQIEPNIRIMAARELLDRGWGKPNQPHDAKVDGELRIVIRKMLKDDEP